LSFFQEAASRAMAAVTRQMSLRAQPEAVAGGVTLSWNAEVDGRLHGRLGDLAPAVDRMRRDLEATGLLDLVAWRNGASLTRGVINAPDRNALLPMAFPGGAPANRVDGVGRAAVAGTCATLLKALFEMFEEEDAATPPAGVGLNARPAHIHDVLLGMLPELPSALFAKPVAMTSVGGTLRAVLESEPRGGLLRAWNSALGASACTLRDEIDKLAANVAIAPCLAGCCYRSDQHAALRLGERVAVGLLRERMTAWRGPASLRFNSFDGDRILLMRADASLGEGGAQVHVWNERGEGGTAAAFETWWQRR
jgi:hypothetical protein